MVILPVTKWWDRFGDQTKLDKINEIINGVLQRDPDHDSGWFTVGTYTSVARTHDLGTDLCLVYFFGYKDSGDKRHHNYYGALKDGTDKRGMRWHLLTSTQITAYRMEFDSDWNQCRFMIWKLEGTGGP